jgi:uncharacterized protein with FMN-binding domain
VFREHTFIPNDSSFEKGVAMNRAIPAAIITAVGLGALASFRSTTGLASKSAGAIVVPRTTAPASAPPPSQGKATTPSTSPSTTGPTAAAQNRTITGSPVDNRYGTVQVQVTLHGTQITGISALQMPSDRQRSLEISQQAEPLLQQEVLQAQSAQINIVSGATFTSESYAQSLQAALDQAHA